MVFCHTCRSAPKQLAHFDFILPEGQATTPENDASFSGVMKISLGEKETVICGAHIRRVSVSKIHFLESGLPLSYESTEL